MVRRRGWHLKEIEFLAKNYASMTIKELKNELERLSGHKRSADSINAKIKRMKAAGRIEGHKEQEAVNRSLVQRRKDV